MFQILFLRNFIVELLNTFIEVTMPLNPLEPVNPVINSCGVVGTGAITCGTIDVEYPIPPSLIVTEVMTPLVILPVAVATCVLIPVVGTPTEIDVVVYIPFTTIIYCYRLYCSSNRNYSR